jgi:hypothetical protein
VPNEPIRRMPFNIDTNSSRNLLEISDIAPMNSTRHAAGRTATTWRIGSEPKPKLSSAPKRLPPPNSIRANKTRAPTGLGLFLLSSGWRPSANVGQLLLRFP